MGDTGRQRENDPPHRSIVVSKGTDLYPGRMEGAGVFRKGAATWVQTRGVERDQARVWCVC